MQKYEKIVNLILFVDKNTQISLSYFYSVYLFAKNVKKFTMFNN